MLRQEVSAHFRGDGACPVSGLHEAAEAEAHPRSLALHASLSSGFSGGCLFWWNSCLLVAAGGVLLSLVAHISVGGRIEAGTRVGPTVYSGRVAAARPRSKKRVFGPGCIFLISLCPYVIRAVICVLIILNTSMSAGPTCVYCV